MKRKVRIVLADDHALVRHGLRHVVDPEADLEICGEASTAEEAVRLVAEHRPDVLLLDITMPGGGGIGALARIRAASVSTRVLMLTMHEDPEYVRVALASGASGFVLKHAAGREILAAIRSVHAGQTYVDPVVAGAALRGALAGGSRRSGRQPGSPLSDREIEVLRELAFGRTNKEIAARLSVSIKSVETYRARLSEKLGLSGRAELVRYALENGVVVPEKAVPRRK
jgi:DNA-binding NarL/FixJ family response regulator